MSKWKLILISAALGFMGFAEASPSVRVDDVTVKRIEMATNAEVTDDCLFGKNDKNVNFIMCTQKVGDLSKGIYQVKRPALELKTLTLSFQLVVDRKSLKKGLLTYVFLETEVDDPQSKPSEDFLNQVKAAIDLHGPARLEIVYYGENFDTSSFGTSVPLYE